MIKRRANTLSTIFFIVSIIFLTIISLKKFSNEIIFYSTVIYAIFAVVIVFLLRKAVHLADKPKHDVKIIYKGDVKKVKQQKKEETEEASVNKFFKDFKAGTDKEKFAEEILRRFAKHFDIVTALFFLWDKKEQHFYIANTFAFYSENTDKKFKIGEGITGQVAKNQKTLIINNVPPDYIEVVSGLGEGSPKHLAFIPVVDEDEALAVIEIAAFSDFGSNADEIFGKIAKRLRSYVKKFV